MTTNRGGWHHVDAGTGPPLVLLHGIGMSSAVWTPVMPLLARTRRVIALDIPGFGRTPPLGAVAPSVQALVDDLERVLAAHGLVGAGIGGNSLGGLLALEAARRGLARRVVAISPPCLWASRPPRHVPVLFSALRTLSQAAPSIIKLAMRSAAGRELLLAIPLSAGSRRMPFEDACRVVDDLAAATAFEATFAATGGPFVARDIDVPVTVAFGRRDWIVPPSARRHEALPPHATWLEPPGWGHVPMWVDPIGVARLLLEGA